MSDPFLPPAYQEGGIEFLGLKIHVNRDVLIPRLETELLGEKIIEKIPSNQEGVLIDLCTGSGVLGLAIKKMRPKLHVILSDISEKALNVARDNAGLNTIDCECLKGDLFDVLQGERVDFVVCNPPYISEIEYETLDRSVKDYEPKIALVGGKDGLIFYRRLAVGLESHLIPGGKAFFEIGYNQGGGVKEIFSKAGFKHFSVENDYSGHNRFFFLENRI